MPIGINVESVSIVREEIDGAHTLFQSLQRKTLDWHSYQKGKSLRWAIRWIQVDVEGSEVGAGAEGGALAAPAAPLQLGLALGFGAAAGALLAMGVLKSKR